MEKAPPRVEKAPPSPRVEKAPPRVEKTPPPKIHKIQKFLPSLNNYIPPSHILKIVRDAENITDSDSNSSYGEGEQSFVLHDRKPGKYRRSRDNKYVLIDSGKSKKRKVKKKVVKKKPSTSTKREVKYIEYADDEDTDDENADNEILDGKTARNLKNYEDETKLERMEGDDSLMFIPDINDNTNREIGGKLSTDVEGMDLTPAFEEEEEGEEEEELNADEKVKKEKTLMEKYSNLRQDTPEDFDAKKIYDADSDVDEFGRRKDRQRPSSSIYDYLPPLRPDAVLDEGDVNKCKERLMQNTVVIREALARNDRKFLSSCVEITPMKV